MYEAIREQPRAFVRSVERNQEAVGRLDSEISGRGRLFFVGIGTSHHAARLGEHMVRVYGGGVPVQAVPSFDFALYGPALTGQELVIWASHRGSKRYTVEVLKRAAGGELGRDPDGFRKEDPRFARVSERLTL